MDVTPDAFTTQQRAVYNSTEPLLLVTGGPGTGKTAVALWTARHALEREPPSSSRRALFLTFSRAAVAELLYRAPRILGGDLGTRVEIMTFHGFATSLLNSFGRYDGRGLEPISVLTEPEEALGLGAPGALRYREIIPAALQLLERLTWLREEYSTRYAVVVSDEYQDANSDMNQLLEVLSGASRLICMADLDQMIYEGLPDSDVSVRRIEAFQARGPREIPLESHSHRDPTNLIPRLARALMERRFDDPAFREALSADRLRIRGTQQGLHDDAVAEIRALLRAGLGTVGVFVSQRKMVQELADLLRAEGIEHEIAGLGSAGGHAQLAAAAMAQYVVGEQEWQRVLEHLGLFYAASSSARKPPDLARSLAAGATLPPGLTGYVAGLSATLDEAAGQPLSQFLSDVRAWWASAFAGRYGVRLWEMGIDDLQGQLLASYAAPLDVITAEGIRRVAQRRHLTLAIDDLPSSSVQVRLMTTFQAKGRELDAVVFIHDARDVLADSPFDRRWANQTRLQYVAVSRARSTVVIVLDRSPQALFAPLTRLVT